jgi:hypothetical protein
VFEPPRLVLEDPARLARLMQAARSSSNASPRRLEGPTSGGNLTPRIAGGAGGAPAMQASLTMVGGSGSSTGVPRFVLSWLGGPADASGSGVAASAPDVVRGAAADAPAKDTAAAAVAAAPGGSPVKAAFGGKVAPASKGPAHIEPQNGTLVFSPQAKVGPWGVGGQSSGFSTTIQLNGLAQRWPTPAFRTLACEPVRILTRLLLRCAHVLNHRTRSHTVAGQGGAQVAAGPQPG